MAEIIELSDEDSDPQYLFDKNISNLPKEKVFKCLNPNCRSSLNLVKASTSIRRFYRAEEDHKRRKVCSRCLSNVTNERNSIVNLFTSGQNLVSCDFKTSKNTVILPDSDSDKTDEESSGEESEFEYDINQLKPLPSFNSDSVSEMSQLESVVADIISELNLSSHLYNGANILEDRLKNAEKGFEELNLEFDQIEKNINRLRENFYNSFKCDIKYLPQLHIGPPEIFVQPNDSSDVIAEPLKSDALFNLPPDGPLVRNAVKKSDRVYVMSNSQSKNWVEGKVLSIENPLSPKDALYEIQFQLEASKKQTIKKMESSYLAYFNPCPTRVPVGTKVIAKYEAESGDFHVGVVGEKPTGANKYRYLIFFDFGNVGYVDHLKIRVVVYSSPQVWEDLSAESQEFVKDYLSTYPERPMVRLQKSGFIKTECEGKWWKAQVLEIDCSLVKLEFLGMQKTEWLYRGSTRLNPLFEKKYQTKIKPEIPNKIIRRRTLPVNKSGPVLEYVNFGNEDKDSSLPCNEQEKRAVARKSTGSKMTLNTIPIEKQLVLESEGYYSCYKVNIKLSKFSPHQCSSKCIKEPSYIIYSKSAQPLTKPISLGWVREHYYEKKKTVSKSGYVYVAPCGRRLRNLDEVLMFLRLTNSKLQIDNFTTNAEIQLLRQWQPSVKHLYIEDITDGNEDIHISCVNSIDKFHPKNLVYINKRMPSQKVGMNLDPNYLVCCQCEDDCQDKLLCECWQLTIEAAKSLLNGEIKVSDIGYKYRRLNEQLPSGIFECNSNCSCKSSCLNRVVQFPIKQQLQLFKTAKRGWGVRTMHDIPKGTLLCVYVGKVLTETEANEEGMTDGADDYYANLDFIEVVESIKEGYESDVENIEEMDEVDVVSLNNNSGVNWSRLAVNSQKENTSKNSQSINLKETVNELSQNRPSMRDFYISDEAVYVMDAKVTGNIGRYLNHSCDPNVFVQNTFVDTHDPRFPWISFFAAVNIKAGMELTWDYNYEVGSVPGRVKYCYCRSLNCRGRLL